jgi:hypothetical protein
MGIYLRGKLNPKKSKESFMLVDYLTMELSLTASDKEIRKRYLELIRRHTPEKDPETFQKISAAYEHIRDEPSRIRTLLFEPMKIKDTETAILDLIDSAKLRRQRVGLKTLFTACEKRR